MKLGFYIIFLLVGIFFIASTSLVSGISLSCSPCYVGQCACTSDCSSGQVNIFEEKECKDAPKWNFAFSENIIRWNPESEGEHKIKIICDNGELSGCMSLVVAAKPSDGGRKRTTVPTTISTTSTTSTTTSTTTTSTTTSSTTSSLTTTSSTTTLALPCNSNGFCEPEEGENYRDCQQDCPSGSNDNYCDAVEDEKCDPDCLSWEDKDCLKAQCGNGLCETSLGEDYKNCPQDCEKPVICGDNTCNWVEGENYLSCSEDCSSGMKDGYCDAVKDERCDPDCEKGEDPDCGTNFLALLMEFFPYLLGLMALMVVGLIFVLRRRKKKGEIGKERIREWVKKKLKDGEEPEILRRSLREEGLDPGLVDEAEEKLWS